MTVAREIRVGLIGYGMRGRGLLKDAILPQTDVTVTAVCERIGDLAAQASDVIEEYGHSRPKIYEDYRDLIADDSVDAVVIATGWESHVEIAVASMKAGKPAAMEVGGAYCIEQCWELVNTYEDTKTPFMFLENCCFGKTELMLLNMVRSGVLGTIVHCSGGYQHDLRESLFQSFENKRSRLQNYLSRNCDSYPTHALGPIAMILDLNRGNRMITLTSTASKAAGLSEYISERGSENAGRNHAQIVQGDVVTTVIKCARGETIALSLNTTLPSYYSRGFTVRGTKGMYEEATNSVFLDSEKDKALETKWLAESVNNAEAYEKEYLHPIWKEYQKEGVRGQHNGMDWLEFRAFFDALRNNTPMPIDVCDAAGWMAVTALSESSIARGGMPVDVPDFSKGKWHINQNRSF